MDEYSDIDLLIITDFFAAKKGASVGREVHSSIPRSLLPTSRRLKLTVYSKSDFEGLYHRGSLFAAHIIKEGVVLHDDGFYANLLKTEFTLSKEALRQSLEILKQRLSVTDDLKKFNDLFITCLSLLFAISKNTAYIALALREQPIFDKKKAFDEFGELFPPYKHKIRRLYALRPFFLRNVRGIDVPLPFEPYGCEKKVADLREDARVLLGKVIEHGD